MSSSAESGEDSLLPTHEYTPLISKEAQFGKTQHQEEGTIFSFRLVLCSFVFLLLLYYISSPFHFGACTGGKGTLVLNGIALSDLGEVPDTMGVKTVEPYIIFQYDGKLMRSEVKKDCGNEASWNNLDMEFGVTQQSLDYGHPLMIAIMDENVGLKDKHIGKMNLPLSDYIFSLKASKQSFSIPKIGDDPLEVKDKNNKVLGHLVMDFELVCRSPVEKPEMNPFSRETARVRSATTSGGGEVKKAGGSAKKDVKSAGRGRAY